MPCSPCPLTTQQSRGFHSDVFTAADELYRPAPSTGAAPVSEGYAALHRALTSGDIESFMHSLQRYDVNSSNHTSHTVRARAAARRRATKPHRARLPCPDVRSARRAVGRGSASRGCGVRLTLAPPHPPLLLLLPPLQVLHLACRHGSVDAVRALLQAGALVRSADMDGKTPLHDAAWFSKAQCGAGKPSWAGLEIARMLIDWDESLLRAVDRLGCTPLDYVPAAQASAWTGMLSAQADAWWNRKDAPGVSKEEWRKRLEHAVVGASGPPPPPVQAIIERCVRGWEADGLGRWAGGAGGGGAEGGDAAAPARTSPMPRAVDEVRGGGGASAGGSAPARGEGSRAEGSGDGSAFVEAAARASRRLRSRPRPADVDASVSVGEGVGGGGAGEPPSTRGPSPAFDEEGTGVEDGEGGGEGRATTGSPMLDLAGGGGLPPLEDAAIVRGASKRGRSSARRGRG